MKNYIRRFQSGKPRLVHDALLNVITYRFDALQQLSALMKLMTSASGLIWPHSACSGRRIVLILASVHPLDASLAGVV